jgi:hypothetical protein
MMPGRSESQQVTRGIASTQTSGPVPVDPGDVLVSASSRSPAANASSEIARAVAGLPLFIET